MEHYLRTVRIAWGALLFFVIILLIVTATAGTSRMDGALKGGVLTIASFMLICVIAIAGKTLMADTDSMFTVADADPVHAEVDATPTTPGTFA